MFPEMFMILKGSSMKWRCTLIFLVLSSLISPSLCNRCGCHEHTMDCTGQKKYKLEDVDFCSEEISTMILQENYFESVPENLPNTVINLDMKNNRLRSIPHPPVLPPNLEFLDLSDNEIGPEISDELNSFSSLVVLNISDNFISSLDFLPKECNLQVLHISLNNITHLNGNLLGCKNLVELKAASNNIIISSETFTPFTKLIYLGLGSNSIEILPNGVFDNLLSLKVLELDRAGLSNVPDGIFDSLTELQRIYLNNNKISSLSSATFSKLSKLQILKLNFNKLSSVPDLSLLENLKDLDLSNNYIMSIFDNTFSNLKRLNVLKLASNKIEYFPPEVFNKLPSLEELDLSFNLDKNLPENILFGLNNLKIISLREMNLTAKHMIGLQHLNNLEEIDVGENNIEQLQPSVFVNMNGLRKLILKDNPLNDIKGTHFSSLSQLKTLDLSNTGLMSVPEDLFSKLNSVEELLISYNKFPSLPEGVFKFNKKLRALILTSSQLESLPENIFDGLDSLERVYLGHNKIGNVPAFRNHPLLTEVLVQDNAIAEPKEESMRLLLEKPHCMTQLYMNPVRPASLKWALQGEYVVKLDRRMCNCGQILNINARIRICVVGECGRSKPFKNFIELITGS